VTGSQRFLFPSLLGPNLSGPLIRVDLTSLTDFKIPIFFVKGEFDLTCPPDLTRAYFDTIRAPCKRFYVVPGTGHNPSWAELKLMRDVLLREVRPIALVRSRYNSRTSGEFHKSAADYFSQRDCISKGLTIWSERLTLRP